MSKRPQDYRHVYTDENRYGLPEVSLHDGQGCAAALSWNPDSGTIDNVDTRENLQHQGLATYLWHHVREHYAPHLRHDDDEELSDEGHGWARAMGGPNAPKHPRRAARQAASDYRMDHRPPGPHYGAPLHAEVHFSGGKHATQVRGDRQEHGWTYRKRGPGELFKGSVDAVGPAGQKDSFHGTGLTQPRHPEHLIGPMYHGTRREIPGSQIEPGHPGNFVKRMKHVYMTSDLDEARHYAGPSGHVFEVRPTGWYGHRADAKGTSWASEDPLDIVDRVPHGKTAAVGPEKDSHRLRFTEPEEEFTGGSRWPNEGEIQAHHPEHGQVGSVTYFRGSRVNSPIMIKMLKVHKDHRRRGYGSALMNQLQQQFPKARIKHGDRTDTGKDWWADYGKGKADRRGRTADRHPFVHDACAYCGGTGELSNGSECGLCDGSGHEPECGCGRRIELDPLDGWQHADGSISHDLDDGRWSDMPVSEVVRAIAAFTPHLRLFGPTFGLDHRLFDGDHLKPEIRNDIVRHFSDFCVRHGYAAWTRWAKLFFFGSEASEWTDSNLEGNGDFDLSLGVEYDLFRQANPQHAGMADREIAQTFTDQMHAELNDSEKYFEVASAGPFDQTWFCNPDGYDITRIKPYAAYDVVTDAWVVHPPHLPEWSIDAFPEGHPLVEMAESIDSLIQAILKLPEPYRTQQGNALWEHLHSDRSRAFSPQGEGWYDPANVIEKYLDQEGTWQDLWELHHRADEDPRTLLAPAGWSNDPRT